MISYMGYEATQYGFSKVLADKALILLGAILFLVSLVTIIGV